MGQPLKSSHRTRGTGARPPPLSLRLSPPTWEQQSCTVLCLRAECLHVRCSYGWVWAGDPGCSKETGEWLTRQSSHLCGCPDSHHGSPTQPKQRPQGSMSPLD